MIGTQKYDLWMDNPEWFEFDEHDNPYLTEVAPQEAIDSFNACMEQRRLHEETGIFY